MQRNYIILAHRNPAQLNRLVLALDDGNSKFYIHVDMNSRLEDFEEVGKNSNVKILKNRISCAWGDFSLVEATLNCIREIICDRTAGYTILLSGQDYPLVSNSLIDQFFEKNNGIDFIDCTPAHEKWPNDHKQRLDFYRFTLSPKRKDYVRIPYVMSRDILNPQLIFRVIKKLVRVRCSWNQIGFILKTITKKRKKPLFDWVGGSQWFAISNSTLLKIYAFCIEREDYCEFHKFTHVPDEIFFNTITKKLQQEDATIKINPGITYANWDGQNVPLPITFTQKDLAQLKEKATRYLFARKFDMETCDNILDMLDQIRG